MKSNTLTLSQAHKVYTGKGMGVFTLWLSLAGALMFFGSIAALFIMGLISEGNATDAFKELNGTAVINTFLTIDAGIILVIFGLMNYDKQFPGGKYFRTVNGGFDTYRKMKNASLIARVTALIITLTLGVLADISGLLNLAYGTSDVVYIGAFLLLSIALINFMSLIKNPAVRGFLTPFAVFIAGLFGVILPNVFDGNIWIALVIAVATVPFIIISQMIMLNDYKKNQWNN